MQYALSIDNRQIDTYPTEAEAIEALKSCWLCEWEEGFVDLQDNEGNHVAQCAHKFCGALYIDD